MAASDHLNPNQMKMFMRPSEIKNTVSYSVDGERVGEDEVWYSKQDDSMVKSIKKHGVKTPVILSHEGSSGVAMGNGHHRVENAHRLEVEGHETYVPVLHTSYDYMGERGTQKAYPSVYRAGRG